MIKENTITREFLFKVNQNKYILLSDLPGKKESISIKTMILLGLKETMTGLKVVKNNSYNICLVDFRNQAIRVESLLDSMLNKCQNYENYTTYPVMLPCPDKLDLTYAVDNFSESVPKYWIESDGEEK